MNEGFLESKFAEEEEVEKRIEELKNIAFNSLSELEISVLLFNVDEDSNTNYRKDYDKLVGIK